MASTLVYTSSREASARREAAAARREAAAQRAMARVTAEVREEAEWFNCKIINEEGKWRVQGWSAAMVARAILDPETEIEYWPTPDPEGAFLLCPA